MSVIKTTTIIHSLDAALRECPAEEKQISLSKMKVQDSLNLLRSFLASSVIEMDQKKKLTQEKVNALKEVRLVRRELETLTKTDLKHIEELTTLKQQLAQKRSEYDKSLADLTSQIQDEHELHQLNVNFKVFLRLSKEPG